MNENHSVTSNSLWPYGLYSPLSSPGQNTGVSSSSLLQGIFPTQGSNPGLPHCRQILYQLNYQGSPRILQWVVYPFSRGSFWPRNRTRVSCIAGRFFTNWATRKALTVFLGHPLIDTIKVIQINQFSTQISFIQLTALTILITNSQSDWFKKALWDHLFPSFHFTRKN